MVACWLAGFRHVAYMIDMKSDGTPEKAMYNSRRFAAYIGRINSACSRNIGEVVISQRDLENYAIRGHNCSKAPSRSHKRASVSLPLAAIPHLTQPH